MSLTGSFNWLALIGLLAPAAVWFTRARRSAWKRDLLIAALLSLCLMIPLSGLIQSGPARGTCYIFLLDWSGSARTEQTAIIQTYQQYVRELQTAAAPQSRALTVLFAQKAWPVHPPVPIRDLRTQFDNLPDLGEETALDRAVQTGLAEVPQGYIPRLVIIGDGTADDKPVIVPGDIDYSYITINTKQDDAAIISADLPAVIPADKTVQLQTLIQARSAGPAAVRLFKGQPRVLVDTVTAELHPGVNQFSFQIDSRSSGLMLYTVEVEQVNDSCPANDRLTISTVIAENNKPSVLVLGSEPPEMSFSADWILPEKLVTVELNRYQAVILNDVPYKAIPAAGLDMLKAYVTEQGGGLLAIGRSRMFAPGGYHGTVLDSMLPLQSRPREPEGENRRILIAVDRSGSMAEILPDGSGTRIDAAKSAALSFILDQQERPGTRIGLLFFSAGIDLIKSPDVYMESKELISSLRSGIPHGGTRIISALEEGISILEENPQENEDRYLFILSDGITREEIPEKSLADASARLSQAGINLMTLNIDPSGGGMLAAVTRQAGGTYYQLQPGDTVQTRFSREAESAASKLIIQEKTGLAMGSGSRLIGLDAKQAECGGYIRTSLQSDAFPVFISEPDEDPVAAVRFAGRGRCAAISSIGLNGESEVLGLLLEWVKGYGVDTWQHHIKRHDNTSKITVFAPQEPEPGTTVMWESMRPDVEPVRLIRRKPSEFSANIPIENNAAYRVTVNGLPIISGRYQTAYPDEYNPVLRKAAVFIQGPVLEAEQTRGRRELPWILTFLILFVLFEIIRSVRSWTEQT